MKQTAVEWLKSELTEVERNLINKTFLQLNNSLAGHRLKGIFEQAKELEKQQAEEIWKASQENMHRQFSSDAYKPITFEQYYTETYETE